MSFKTRVDQIKKKLFERPSFDQTVPDTEPRESISEHPEATTRPTDLALNTMPSVAAERNKNSGDHIILNNIPQISTNN